MVAETSRRPEITLLITILGNYTSDISGEIPLRILLGLRTPRFEREYGPKDATIHPRTSLRAATRPGPERGSLSPAPHRRARVS